MMIGTQPSRHRTVPCCWAPGNGIRLAAILPAHAPDLPRPRVEACGYCGETDGYSPSPGGEGRVEGGSVSSHRDIYFHCPGSGSWAQCAKNVPGVLSPMEMAGLRGNARILLIAKITNHLLDD